MTSPQDAPCRLASRSVAAAETLPCFITESLRRQVSGTAPKDDRRLSSVQMDNRR